MRWFILLPSPVKKHNERDHSPVRSHILSKPTRLERRAAAELSSGGQKRRLPTRRVTLNKRAPRISCGKNQLIERFVRNRT
jgi:hypothetical protein